MLLAALMAVPAIAAAIAWFLPGRSTRTALLVLVALLHLAGTLSLWRTGAPATPGGWFAVDAAGLLVLTVLSLVFLAVAVYTPGFLRPEPVEGDRGFVACLLAFLAAGTVVALAHHLAILWVGMEATTLALAPLVIFRRTRRSLEAAWKYLVLSSVGIALALLGTFFLAGAQTDGRPLILADLVRHADHLHPGLLRGAFIFLLVGYGTKMGLAPLHTWKPDTYGEAPGPVAALMAGALTSCAFLGLVRITQVMVAAHQAAFMRAPLFALGLASLAIAAAFMIGQTDIKRLLAYSSVEHMGILAIGLGIGSAGAWGAALHLVNNGLAKSAMFLAAGNLVLAARSSEAAVARGGLRRAPITALLLLAGLFAVSGSPPFGLFLSELTILGAAYQARLGWLALLMLALFAVIFFGMARMLLVVIYGEPAPGSPRLAETPPLVGGPIALVGLVLLLGLYIPAPLRTLLEQTAQSLSGGRP